MKVSVNRIKLEGSVNIPASKSHTIRALIIASLANGNSRIISPLDSADTRACADACRALGAEITLEDSEWTVKGTRGKIKTPVHPVNVGNSGTTLYLCAGTAALGTERIIFTGDSQIQSRPIQPLLNSLSDLGAETGSINNNDCAPVYIKGPLGGGKTSIECPTSQYLSSLLLCAPLAKNDTEITVPLLYEQPYAEMTLKWLKEQSISFHNDNFKHFFIPGRQDYTAFSRSIPADFSSAAFFLTAAAVTGSKVTLKGLDMNDSQGDKAVVYLLKEMGCGFEISENAVTITGPSGSKTLKGCNFDLNAIPDALPALAVAGCCAKGVTRLLNVPQARLKETDRIAVMKHELEKMGAKIEELPDGLVITGSGNKKPPLAGCEVNGCSDHRVVMALAVAGLAAAGTTTIDTAEAVDITFPSFFKLLDKLKVKKSHSTN